MFVFLWLLILFYEVIILRPLILIFFLYASGHMLIFLAAIREHITSWKLQPSVFLEAEVDTIFILPWDQLKPSSSSFASPCLDARLRSRRINFCCCHTNQKIIVMQFGKLLSCYLPNNKQMSTHCEVFRASDHSGNSKYSSTLMCAKSPILNGKQRALMCAACRID